MVEGGLVASGVYAALCLAAVSGWYLLFQREMKALLARVKLRKRLRGRQDRGDEGLLEMRLRLALSTVTGRPLGARSFLLWDLLLFVLVLVSGRGALPFSTALLMAGIAAILPFLLLFLRLESIRRKGSREGELLMTEFLRQYRITGGNVYETLERVVESGDGFQVCQRLLYRLLLDLQNTGSEERIRRASEDFAGSIDTGWSRMLGHNIAAAAVEGIDISMASEDILIQLRDARVLEEERKRLNSEASRMTMFMVPITYFATIFMAVRYLDTPLSRFLSNQFRTGEGLLFFLLIVFLFLINLSVIALVNHRKFDY